MTKKCRPLIAVLLLTLPAIAQTPGASLAGLSQAKDYVLRRSSSYDRSGGNADYRQVAP